MAHHSWSISILSLRIVICNRLIFALSTSEAFTCTIVVSVKVHDIAHLEEEEEKHPDEGVENGHRHPGVTTLAKRRRRGRRLRDQDEEQTTSCNLRT